MIIDKINSPNELNQINLLKNGSFILAQNSLEDPNFKETLILICEYNDDGAFGLIINRPTHMPLSEVFNGELAKKLKKRPLYIGGPVMPESLQIIQITDKPAKDSLEIEQNVYLGGEWESIEEIFETDETKSRIFLGYSGWGPKQLETEILAGAWKIYNLNVKDILSMPDNKIIENVKNMLSETQ